MKFDNILKGNFASSDLDVVGGISETFLNEITNAYFNLHSNSQVFYGTLKIEALDLIIEYKFVQPPYFDLGDSDGSNQLIGAVKEIRITASSLQNGDKLASLTVEAIVEGHIEHSYNYLHFWTDKVNLTITERINNTSSFNGCDLDRLIEHILEYFVRDQINIALGSIPIPSIPEFISGFETTFQSINIEDDFILVGLIVKDREFQTSFTQESLFVNLFKGAPKIEDVDYRYENDRHSATGTITFKNVTPILSDITKVPGGRIEELIPERNFNFFTAFSAKAFQRIADLEFNRTYEESNSHNGDGTFWWYSTGIQTTNASVNIIDQGLKVTARVRLWARGEAAKKFIWPINWEKVALNAEGNQRITVNANLGTRNENREIWLYPEIEEVNEIKVKFSFKPKLLDYLIGWLVRLLLRVLYNFVIRILTVISIFLKIKIVTIPEQLPISLIPIKPNDVTIGNWKEKLFFGVRLTIIEQHLSD